MLLYILQGKEAGKNTMLGWKYDSNDKSTYPARTRPQYCPS
jgi:hypothetical protein